MATCGRQIGKGGVGAGEGGGVGAGEGDAVGVGEGDAGAVSDEFFIRRCSQDSVSFMCNSLALKATSDVKLWPNQALMAS